jgi:hypothetical protein
MQSRPSQGLGAKRPGLRAVLALATCCSEETQILVLGHCRAITGLLPTCESASQ